MDVLESSNSDELLTSFVDANPSDVQLAIEKVVETTLQQLINEDEVAFSVIARTKSNAVYCKEEQSVRLKHHTVKRKLSDGKKYQGIWKVLQVCYTLAKSKNQLNQRELYYMNTDVNKESNQLILQIFDNQRECDDCIQDTVALLRIPRDALGITATSKGYVYFH